MSTRATYEFTSNRSRKATVYIHHDGYPSGAASYMIEAIKQSGGFLTVEAMIRANERAEITTSHGTHGDTEYRYTIIDERDGGVRVVIEHRNLQWHPDEFRQAGVWPLDEFLNAHGAEFCADDLPIKRNGWRYMTAAMARECADKAEADAASYAERFPQYTGNIASGNESAKRARAFADSFNVAPTE